MSKNESLAVIIDSNYSDTGCDESKCVSHGLAWLFAEGSLTRTLTCYSDDDRWPMACSYGYQPRTVDSEPVVLSKAPKWGTMKYQSRLFHYFTCCPPGLPPDTNVTRDCSDPTPIINNNTKGICENDTQPYARQMERADHIESSMCCSTLINNSNKTTTSFLNDTECVPFRNTFHDPTTIKNRYGHIYPVLCYHTGIYKVFEYPREVVKDKDNQYGIFQYKCCRTKSTKLPHLYIRGFAFKTTIYPKLVVSSIAVFSLLLFIVALLIPLFLLLGEKRKQTTHTTTILEAKLHKK